MFRGGGAHIWQAQVRYIGNTVLNRKHAMRKHGLPDPICDPQSSTTSKLTLLSTITWKVGIDILPPNTPLSSPYTFPCHCHFGMYSQCSSPVSTRSLPHHCRRLLPQSSEQEFNLTTETLCCRHSEQMTESCFL